jgi:hypothetical protein
MSLNNQVLELSDLSTEKKIKLDYAILKRAVLTLRAVNHPLRKEIIATTRRKKENDSNRTLCKTSYRAVCRISASCYFNAKADVLMTERDGKFIYYAINAKRVEEISQLIEHLAQ